MRCGRIGFARWFLWGVSHGIFYADENHLSGEGGENESGGFTEDVESFFAESAFDGGAEQEGEPDG